jgi:Tfp pilus assembly protein PilO
MNLTPCKPKRPWHVDAAGIALAFIFALGAYALFVVPAHRRLAQADRLAADRAAAQQRRRDLESAVRRAADELAAIKQTISRGALQLESESRLNQRIAALTQCASRAGLALDGIEPGARRSGPLFHVVPIRLAGKGRYSQVRSFVSALHREMPDTPVTSMSLAAVPSTDPPTVTFTIELHWHTAVTPPAQTPTAGIGGPQ